MNMKTNSIMKNDINDEYFIPLEPDHALALTMNFPQFPELHPSNISDTQADFDYNCPDCVANLFGPIMAPYAVLQQQTDDYRLRLEHIAHRRYIAMKSNIFNSFEKDFARQWKRTFKHPFKYDIKSFLTRIATTGRYIAMVSGGWIFIIGVGLLGFAIYLILVGDQQQPLFTFIRTFSKFYRTFLFQGVIGCLIFYSILLIVAALCSSLGALLCSFLLTLLGLLSILLALAFAIVVPVILYMNKSAFVDKLEQYMRVSIRDFDNLPENPVAIFWNELQEKYSCCGLNDSIRDYRQSYFHQLTRQNLPQSCCQAKVLCAMNPMTTNSFVNISCLPQAKIWIDSTTQITSIGDVIVIILLLIALISMGLFFLHIDAAKQALNEHNEFIIKSMLSTLEQYEKELGVHDNAVSDETKFRDQQRIQGILPITPTVVRVKSPRIMNYLGFS